MSTSDDLKVDDLIGVPFVDGGRDPHLGLDCWGLVLVVFNRATLLLPDYRIGCHDTDAIGVAVAGERLLGRWRRWNAHDVPTPALVAIRFNSPLLVNHTGVYVGEGKFLHTRETTGVVVEKIDSPAWRHRIEGFYTPEIGRF
jgi:cell wall-associated NlpC family hydrolase